MNLLDILGLAAVVLLLIVVHLMARRHLYGEPASPKKRTSVADTRYAAQGCLFVLICILVGWLLALAT
jgi:hypothetical protein